ncbi:hypothetical protein Tco_1478759, partial [Tanacetum coccineum]
KEYKRDCEIRIQKLKQDFNEWGSEVRKKEQAYNEERCFAARRRMFSITFIDEDDYIPLGDIITRYSTSKAITPDLPNEEPDNLLSKGDEHLSTSDKNLVPIPNILTVSNPKIDSLLEEFFGELAHIDLIPSGINKADFDSEEEIRLIEEMLYDSSSPRPPEEFNSEISDATIESSFPSSIPVEGSDSLMEEIDLFLASYDSMPPGIENNDYDSEGDIRFLEELLINDSPPLPKNESSNLDHFNEPSSSRPPSEPPIILPLTLSLIRP